MSGYATVLFDCDSTLVRVEGIDELSGPFRDEIQALTDAAMAGEVPLEEVYGRRLALIRPTREQVQAVGRRYVDTLVPHAREVVAALRWLGKTVRIISGGLRPPVEMVAAELGIPADDVRAVDIHFDAGGAYAGFDDAAPLARSGGKTLVIGQWNLPRPSLLIGDGVTDREARPAVDAFAAYTAVVHRPAAVDGADYVLRHESLAPVLSIACSPEELERLRDTEWAPLLDIAAARD